MKSNDVIWAMNTAYWLYHYGNDRESRRGWAMMLNIIKYVVPKEESNEQKAKVEEVEDANG